MFPMPERYFVWESERFKEVLTCAGGRKALSARSLTKKRRPSGLLLRKFAFRL